MHSKSLTFRSIRASAGSKPLCPLLTCRQILRCREQRRRCAVSARCGVAEPRQRLRDGLRMMSSGMGRRWLRLFLSMRMREGFTVPGQLWRQLLGPEPARNVVGMGAAAGRGGLNKRQKMRQLTWSRISRPFLSSSCFSSCRRKTSES